MAFKDLVKQQRQQGSGILSSVGSAAAGSARESLDIRNALFKSGSLLNTLFPNVKGFKAGEKSTKVKLSSTESSLSATKLDQIGENTKIAAKNSFVLPAMARDMNVMRQNIVKLVKLQGGTASTKADMFFMKAGEREAAYENRIGASKQSTSTSPTKTEAPEKKGGILGMIGGMLGAMGFFNTLLKGLLVAIGAGVALYFASDKFSNFINEQFKSFSGVISKILEPFSGPDSTFILMLSNVVSQLGKFGGAISPILKKLGLLGTALTIIQGKAEANEAERVREKNIKSQSDPNAPKLTPEEQKTLDDWNKKTDFSDETAGLEDLIASGADMSPPPPRPGSERDSSGRYEYEYMLDPDLKRPVAPTVTPSSAPPAAAPPVSSNKPTPQQIERAVVTPDRTSPTPTPASSNPSEGEKAVRAAASKYGITDETEINALLAQVGHESGNYRHLTELGDKSYFERYEGRRDLGNTQPGDGYKYRGRGYIQLTGRSNYEQFAKFSGLDVVNNPDLVATPSVGAEAALWFWKTKVKPNVKDFSDVKAVTQIVNGGYNGLADREQRFASLTKQSTGSATTLASAASPTSTNTVGASLNAGSVQVADGRMAMGSGQSVVVNAPQTNMQTPQVLQRSSGNIPSVVDTDFMRHLVAQLVT